MALPTFQRFACKQDTRRAPSGAANALAHTRPVQAVIQVRRMGTSSSFYPPPPPEIHNRFICNKLQRFPRPATQRGGKSRRPVLVEPCPKEGGLMLRELYVGRLGRIRKPARCLETSIADRGGGGSGLERVRPAADLHPWRRDGHPRDDGVERKVRAVRTLRGELDVDAERPGRGGGHRGAAQGVPAHGASGQARRRCPGRSLHGAGGEREAVGAEAMMMAGADGAGPPAGPASPSPPARPGRARRPAARRRGGRGAAGGMRRGA